MTTAIRLRNGGDLELGAFRLARTCLTVKGRPSFDEWQSCGRVLERIEGAVQFWIGDWINYGQATYHEKYSEALETFDDLKRQTLKNCAYVAANVSSSLRRDDVLFSVHKEIAPLRPREQSEILARAAADHLTVTQVRELVRARAHADKIAAIASGRLTATEYDVICADPPWQYDNAGFNQSAAAHYPVLDVAAIAALPETDSSFPKFADPCVLFLWATSPLLREAHQVMASWGFEYKACLVWVKDKSPGLGWWLNTRHELLLVGARGSSTPLAKVDSVIDAAAADHSRKPIEAYAAIDRMYPPGLRRVECFARAPRDGWDVWGNEV